MLHFIEINALNSADVNNGGVMHSLFLRGHELGGSRWATRAPQHSSHNSTYVLLFFSILFEEFPNKLTISWNILILTFIDYVDL